MRIFQNFIIFLGLQLGFFSSVQANTIQITAVTGTDFGIVPVGTSKTLYFDIESPNYTDYLRTLVQDLSIDMYGATPAPGFSLNNGTCNPQWGITGTKLDIGVGCRFSVTFTPTVQSVVSPYVVATSFTAGDWANLRLTATTHPLSIPTLSQWGLITMSCLLALFTFMRSKRRGQG